MRTYCKKIHKDHKVIRIKVLNIGSETFIEVMFTSNEELLKALDMTSKDMWIRKEHMKFATHSSPEQNITLTSKTKTEFNNKSDKTTTNTQKEKDNITEVTSTSDNNMKIDELPLIQENLGILEKKFVLYRSILGSRLYSKLTVYLEAHFASEENKINAMKNSSIWREFDYLNKIHLSMDKTNKIVELEEPVIPREEITTSKGKEIAIADKFEFH
ncbi:hypothetical protein RCL_jg4947.t1 [Rhizophagus clarus]|uniref:Uncharacterized protein n=1 Tax=Rhizophagus clarus TaxID=94130 RepID=A0A8H3LAY7_9GLOM|nr:hypothetical protein RCL_jg4947.t1 [Rhizophagus clarus]